jgi:uncharacterized protein (TIGR00661 family)
MRTELRPRLTFHRISDRLFLDLMRGCRGLVTTAGFQAVAEAMWLGKPVLMVPTGGHSEQRWNASKVACATSCCSLSEETKSMHFCTSRS